MVAITNKQRIPDTYYRPLFLDRSGDLRPSVERELNSISNAFLRVQEQVNAIPTSGGGGVSGVASFKGRTGVVVPMAGDYSVGMVSGALDKATADTLYQPKGSVSIPIASTATLGGIRVGAGLNIDSATGLLSTSGTSYVLPPATKSTLGGIIVGDNLTIDSNGKLNANAGGSGTTTITKEVDISYIGETKWHNHDVAIPDIAVPQDGQLLLRTEYPDLWAKIDSGDIASVDDATWKATPTGRAHFTKGTDDTNFRVPDLNGKQLNSIKGLFVRGSEQADPNAGGTGTIRESAAPNITGDVTFHGAGNATVINGFGTGSSLFGHGAHLGSYSTPTTPSNGAQSWDGMTIDASKSSVVYGRNSATEVRPNSVSGIWILIAKKPDLKVIVLDSFIGAVSWYNGVRTKPPVNHVVSDGQLLNRVDEPELWALVEDGTLISVSDDDWLTVKDSSDAYNHRGKYSTGNGTTTFRVPDLNGAQADSLGHIYLSSLNPTSTNQNGHIGASSAPEIAGVFSTDMNGSAWMPFPNANTGGAFSTSVPQNANSFHPTAGFEKLTNNAQVNFSAHKANPIYGRGSNTEINPNTAYGCYIIKTKSAIVELQNSSGSGNVGDVTQAGDNVFTGKNEFTQSIIISSNFGGGIKDKLGGHNLISSDGGSGVQLGSVGKTISVNGLTDFNDQKIIKVADPTDPQDVATKAYVDAHAGGGSTPTNMVTTDTTQTITGDKTFTGSATFDGLNAFGNIVAEGAALVDFSGADSVTVPEPTSNSHATTKKYVDDKVAAIGAGGGITIPETLTNMDASDALSTGWYWTDYRTTPSMIVVPNNYGDFAIVNHVVAKQATDNKGFCYQTMFVGGEHFTDAGGTKTMFFRVSPDGVATHWGEWQKIQDQSAAIAKAQTDATKAIDYNHWYLGDDPKVLEYIDWLDSVTATDNLKRVNVKFSPNGIHLKGIIYKTMPAGTPFPNIFSVKKSLAGFTKMRKSYFPLTVDANPGIHFTDYAGAGGTSTFPFIVHCNQNIGAQAGWIMFDELITFE